jgi:hypothetical protein
LLDEIDTAKAKTAEYVSSGKYYTYASIKAYNEAVSGLVNVKISDYITSTTADDQIETQVKAVSTAIKDAVSAYDSATLVECTHSNTSSSTDVTKQEDCGNAGESTTTVTCSDCGYSSSTTNPIPATGNHTAGEAVENVTKKATCEETGTKTVTVSCTVCGNVISSEEKTIELTDHSWNDGETTKPATCTEVGEKTFTCSVCGETKTEEIPVDANAHVYEGTVEANNDNATHKVYCTANDGSSKNVDCTEAAAVKENEVAATLHKDGSYDSVVYCSVCKQELSRTAETVKLDGAEEAISNYNTAVAEANEALAQTDKYTEDSLATLQDVLAQAETDFANATTVAEADVITAAITTATTKLEEKTKTYNVTFKVVKDEDDATTTEKTGVAYGTTLDLEAGEDGYTVYKWNVSTANGTAQLAGSETAISYVVTADATITVYLTSDPSEEEAVSKTKVTVLDRRGNLAEVRYVDEYNQADFTAADVSFYEFTSWKEVKTADGITIKPIYAFVGTAEDTATIKGVDGLLVNGKSETSAPYDSFIFVTNPEDVTLGIITSEVELDELDATKASPIANGESFHAPHAKYVYVVAIEEAKASATITGTYAQNGSVTFNATYYLPAGATLVECGVIASPSSADISIDENGKVSGTNAFAFRGEKQSDKNEFSIQISGVKGLTLNGKAYVIYKDANGNHVVLGDVATVEA